jgi:hypothetical protein
MPNDPGPSSPYTSRQTKQQNLSGVEKMMLRDLAQVKPSNDTILQNCELLRRDLARICDNAAQKKPAAP